MQHQGLLVSFGDGIKYRYSPRCPVGFAFDFIFALTGLGSVDKTPAVGLFDRVAPGMAACVVAHRGISDGGIHMGHLLQQLPRCQAHDVLDAVVFDHVAPTLLLHSWQNSSRFLGRQFCCFTTHQKTGLMDRFVHIDVVSPIRQNQRRCRNRRRTGPQRTALPFHLL